MSTQSFLAAVETNGISPNFRTRQDAARMACEAAGIVWPGTILPEGHALYSSGLDKLKSDRAAWQRLPLAMNVTGLIEEALREEERKDYTADVMDLRLHPVTGRILRRENLANPQKLGLGYGPHTLRQLVQQIDPLDDAPSGFGSALVYLEDAERAEILNKRLDRMTDVTPITLRTRLAHSGGSTELRVARAALSKIYGSVQDGDIARSISAMLNGDTTARLDYKPGDSRSRFEVIWPSEVGVDTFCVGDVHYACLSITNSDTGEGSIVISPAVIRARCANLTLSTGKGTEVKIRHVGDPAMLMQRLQRAIRAAVDEMEPLLATISASARITITETEGWTLASAFKAIADKYTLPKSTPKVWLEQHAKSNYPASVWGAAAAISEAAHDQATWTDEAEWERVASNFQRTAVEAVRGGAMGSNVLKQAMAIA